MCAGEWYIKTLYSVKIGNNKQPSTCAQQGHDCIRMKEVYQDATKCEKSNSYHYTLEGSSIIKCRDGFHELIKVLCD